MTGKFHREGQPAPAPLKSCLRRGRITKSEATSLASTASATTHTPMSSPLQCEPVDPVRTRADAVSSTNHNAQNNLGYNCSERHFMTISHHLVTQYNRGSCTTPSDVKRILYQYLPTCRQRLEYHNSLCRNFAVLPMFPEPGEHVSFSMTRCIHRVFGPVLAGELMNANRDSSSSSVNYLRSEALDRSGHDYAASPLEQHRRYYSSPPIGLDCEAMFPAPMDRYPVQQQQQQQRQLRQPPQQHQNESYPTQQFSPISPNAHSTASTPHDFEGGYSARPLKLTVQTTTTTASTTNKSLADEATMHPSSISPTSQSYPSLLSAARRQQSYFNVSTPPPITSPSLQQNSTATTIHPAATIVHNSPPPEPLPFFIKSPNNTRHTKIDLTSPSHEIVAQLSTMRMNHENDMKSTIKRTNYMTNNLSVITDIQEESNSSSGINKCNNHFRTAPVKDNNHTPKSSAHPPTPKSSQYQRLNSPDMLPPILSREDVLYYPVSKIPPSSPCCFNNTTTSATTHPRQKRPPSYLQLYIKCEWSEPFLQPDPTADIITWYKNKENQVTADRTLVVCGTTTLLELIRSILISFGLYDNDATNGIGLEQSGDATTTTTDLLSSLGCHKQVCFVSDVKSSTVVHPDSSSAEKLTPLPIPGFCYKYVDRGTRQQENNNGSTVLSTDPVVLQRTLASQVFDTPLFPQTTKQYKDRPTPRGRTRLALAYCSKKRHAYLSSRTQRAVLPELIYHFQILLEGIVDENDLPSSFHTQIPVRCVSGIGGVTGGNLIDSEHEVKDLNRKLWGERNVVGLVSPSSSREKNREKIIDVLSIPLFDPMGNQSLKEGVVERALYQLSSGQLSMKIAKRTQGTVDTCIGSTDWLARQVGSITKCVSKKANACMDEDVLNEYDQKLEALVTRVML